MSSTQHLPMRALRDLQSGKIRSIRAEEEKSMNRAQIRTDLWADQELGGVRESSSVAIFSHVGAALRRVPRSSQP